MLFERKSDFGQLSIMALLGTKFHLHVMLNPNVCVCILSRLDDKLHVILHGVQELQVVTQVLIVN
jgi:hypothetical protein